ncbi:hypothetical protein V2J09_008816, partial [Rumex salicifolius]
FTSDDAFLLEGEGKKAVLVTEADVLVEWEPIREGFRSRKGKFLQANRGLLPCKGSLTIDEPTKKTTMKWVMWGLIFLRQRRNGQRRGVILGLACFLRLEGSILTRRGI